MTAQPPFALYIQLTIHDSTPPTSSQLQFIQDVYHPLPFNLQVKTEHQSNCCQTLVKGTIVSAKTAM